MLNRYNNGELFSVDSIHFDEALKTYTLKNHRPVYGGGGIMPDRFVPVDTSNYSNYYRDLIAKNSINTLVLNALDANRKELLEKYPTEDDFYANYTVSQDLIDKLVEQGKKDGVEPNPEQLATSRKMLEAIIRGLLARDLYDNGTYVRSTNPLNPVFNAALDLILDPEQYNSLLNPSGK